MSLLLKDDALARKSFQLWIWVLLVKLVVSAFLPLISDESYYWVWSKYPQWSYYDHPPLTSWLLRLGHVFESFGQGVRWPAVLLGHGVLGLWFFIFRELGIEKNYRTWFWLVVLSPFLGIGSILVTPDLPLLFFWSSSLLFLLRRIRLNHWHNDLGLGISLGLGFLSKYTIVLFVPIALMALWRAKKFSSITLRSLLLVILSGFICCLPVIYWNSQQNWISFQFQLQHGLHQEKFDWRWPLEYLVGQIIAIFPLVLWAAFSNPNSKKSLLYSFAWIPLIFFLVTSWRAPVEANWPLIAYPALYALAVSHDQWGFRWKNWTFASWFVVYLVAFLPLLMNKPQWTHGKIAEPFQTKKFVPLIEKYPPLYTINYQLAASLWYATKSPIYKLSESSRFDFFDEFPEGRPTEFPVYVLKQKHHEFPEWVSKELLRVVEVESIEPDFVVVRLEKP